MRRKWDQVMLVQLSCCFLNLTWAWTEPQCENRRGGGAFCVPCWALLCSFIKFLRRNSSEAAYNPALSQTACHINAATCLWEQRESPSMLRARTSRAAGGKQKSRGGFLLHFKNNTYWGLTGGSCSRSCCGSCRDLLRDCKNVTINRLLPPVLADTIRCFGFWIDSCCLTNEQLT